MKISTARLKRIIKEELFYREFHRGTEALAEVESEKQRRYMCAMKDKDSAKRPEGLSKAEAEEMCTGPMKEDILDDLAGEKMRRAYMKGVPPEKRSTAGTQNLDHLDPDSPDPEGEFFGDKIDPDDVGLQTMNLTPDQMKRLREITRRKRS
jgi:hypothetical protein